MKRPQSAKPGHKGYWGQSSVQDLNDQTNIHKYPNRKQIKYMKPDMTTNDFGRILPRKIQQDKQRLYSQALQLKQNMNEITQENIRLKTKISILQREKQKMNKFIDTAPQNIGGKGSRINNYGMRSNEKDNMIIRNLKKIVRQYRDENDQLKIQNQKIKKMIKYTKINEYEIQKQIILDQNKKLNILLQSYNKQLLDQQQIQKQNQQLKKYLQQQLQQKQKYHYQKNKYQEIINNLQYKLQNQIQKLQNKQKKYIKDINIQKRKLQQLQRKNDDLTRQLKSIKQIQQHLIQNKNKNINNNNKFLTKPIKNNNKSNTSHHLTNQSQDQIQSQKKYKEIKIQYQYLQKQFLSIKQKLINTQKQLLIYKQKQNIHRSNLNISQLQKNQYFKSNIEQLPYNTFQKQQQNQYQSSFQIDHHQQHNISQIQNNSKNQIHEQEQISSKKQSKIHNDIHINNSNNNQQKSNKKQKSTSKKQGYKPNKKILLEIKQLLTYRMKSQRYPFSDIKSDIQSAQTGIFTYADLCNMFINQPFYLTTNYTKVFLSYCFEKQKIQPQQTITNATLITKLRKVIDQFELLQQNQQKQMIIRIAQMTSTYPRQLQVAFENIKNGQQTVGRKQLIQMFKKLQLQDKYIQLIISQLSLCSDDLQHLNFHGFFQRFYIEDQQQDYINNNAIVEQQSQQSYKHSSRIKKQSIKAKSKTISQDQLQNS